MRRKPKSRSYIIHDRQTVSALGPGFFIAAVSSDPRWRENGRLPRLIPCADEPDAPLVVQQRRQARRPDAIELPLAFDLMEGGKLALIQNRRGHLSIRYDPRLKRPRSASESRWDTTPVSTQEGK